MQLNSAIIPDLAPKLILMPDIYSRPPPACPQRLECAINYVSRFYLCYFFVQEEEILLLFLTVTRIFLEFYTAGSKDYISCWGDS